MYSRQQSARLKQEFWTSLGQYMSPVPSSEGEKINWMNYRTGLKGVYFRMEADEKRASIKIDISQEMDSTSQSYFHRLLEYKKNLDIINHEWTWESVTPGEDFLARSKIETYLEGVSIFNKQDWPQLISFFKQHLVALDKFWNSVKYAFENYY